MINMTTASKIEFRKTKDKVFEKLEKAKRFAIQKNRLRTSENIQSNQNKENAKHYVWFCTWFEICC